MMNHARPAARAGFTLIELIVVVLLISIIAAYGIPQYLRGVETTKADNAIALVRMIGAANRMAALDKNGTWVTAEQLTSGTCNTDPCGASAPTTGCDLVRCKYLSAQDWSTMAYDIWVPNAGSASATCGGVNYAASNNWVACANRKSSALSPYNTWGFALDSNGTLTAVGTNPPPTSGL